MHVEPELVEAARQGDQAAFEAIVRATQRPVYSLVYRIVGNHDDAADVTQDVYVKVWRNLRAFRGDAAFGTWLYRVATNAAITWVRRRPQATEPLETEQRAELQAGPGDDPEARLDAEAVNEALRRLPAAQRAVIVLKDVYGMSCEEIGTHMGTTEGAVKVKLFRARQRLADDLAKQDIVVPIDKKKRETR